MSLVTILLIGIAISIGITVITAMVAKHSEREARNTIFPVVREEETLRARQAKFVGGVSTGLTVILLIGWLITLLMGVIANESSDPAAQLTESALQSELTRADINRETQVSAPQVVQVVPTSTPATLPTETTQVAQPTATAMPQTGPTPTSVMVVGRSITTTIPTTEAPAPTPEAVVNTADTETAADAFSGLNSVEVETTQFLVPRLRKTAPEGASLGPIRFTTQEEAEGEPVTKKVFSRKDTPIYALFPYKGLEQGNVVTAVWYKDDLLLWREDIEWYWLDEATSYIYINNSGPGDYRLELYINDSLMAFGTFEVE